MKKKVSILGSTGSIGLNSLKIFEKKKRIFSIYLLAANKNFKLIVQQINKYKPQIFIISDYKTLIRVKKKFTNNSIFINTDKYTNWEVLGSFDYSKNNNNFCPRIQENNQSKKDSQGPIMRFQLPISLTLN